MGLDSFAPIASLLVTLTALILLLAEDWRVSIGTLAIQYAGIFILVGVEWPLTMALVKLIAGWMTGAVLGMAVLSIPVTGEDIEANNPPGAASGAATLPTNRLFRLLAAILVGLAVFSQIQTLVERFPHFSPEQAWAGLALIGLGLLKLGFTARPLPTILGLLTVLGGFEIVYASLENATLTAAMLAGINLGLALAGAYLLLAPYIEESG